MSFCIRFPKHRSPSLEKNLTILRTGASRGAWGQSGIVVSVTDYRLAGHWDGIAERLTTFVSGSLTNVPEGFRPGTGGAAARVLGSLYAAHSVDAFAQVDGSFCAAILDWRQGTITLVRDKLGKSRAYLCRDRESITFSDQLSDLLEAEGRRFDLDIDSMHAFLAIGWIPAPRSMFRGVEKLRPGTTLVSHGGEVTQTTYYDLPHDRSSTFPQGGVAEHLDRSVDSGLSLGGRWGSFLSGGVDSSSVVSSLARGDRRGIPTYFGGFSPYLNRYLPNPEEPAMSQLVANRFKTKHHMLWLGPETVETAQEIVGALEEPVSDGGCIVLGAVMRAAREEVDGLMTGIGGDFLFTGERRHMVLNLLRFMRPVPNHIWRSLRWLSGAQPLASSARLSQMHFDLTRLLALQNLSLEEMYLGFFLQAEETELRALFLPGAQRGVKRDPFQEIHDHFRDAAELAPLDRFLYLDLKTNIPDDLVREADTLGKHFGLNIYNPFLNSEFVDFAMSVPAVDKVSGVKLKVPLKHAMRGRVPDKVLNRKKGGLGSPIRWWVTQPDGFVASVLSRATIDRRGMFSPDLVEGFRYATATGSRDYSKLLWSLFTLELWLRQFVD